MRLKGFFTLALLAVSAVAGAQDFASRFRGMHVNDSNLTCVTISPKMMREILENDENKDEEVVDIIAELKSLQVCTAKVNAKQYFDEALSLADKNKRLFETVQSQSGKDYGSRLVVRRRKSSIIELVMMNCDEKGFSLINFTGAMDESAITRLAGVIRKDEADKE